MDQHLQHFFTLTKQDPLFAAEGADLSNAHAALDQLEVWARQCGDIAKKRSLIDRFVCWWHPLERTLYPIDFLRNVLSSELLRRTFIEAPTTQQAHALIAQYEKTVSALRQHILRFKEAHRLALRIEGKRTSDGSIFQFFDTAVSFKDILDELDLLDENAQALVHDIAARKALLNGATAPLALRAPQPVHIDHTQIAPEESALHKLEEKNFIARSLTDVESYGPLRYTFSGLDASPTAHAFMVYLGNSARSGRPTMHISVADRHYFLDLTSKDADTTMYGPLIERGIRYWYQPAANWYLHRDLSFCADLATAVDRMRRPHLSPRIEEQKSSMLDRLLECAASYTQMQLLQSRVLADNNSLPPLLYLYVARSHASFYYLPFNHSVWRLSKRPRFAGSRFVSNEMYLPFDSIKEKVSHTELETIFAGGQIRLESWKKFR